MRKLIPARQRKPKDFTSHNEILRMISAETGYSKLDIEDIFNVWTDIVTKELVERRRVNVRDIGWIYPVVQAPRTATKFAGRGVKTDWKRTHMDAKWKVKFYPNAKVSRAVGDIMVTKRDLDSIYTEE